MLTLDANFICQLWISILNINFRGKMGNMAMRVMWPLVVSHKL